MLNANIISAIESIAPAYYQESWDNTGVQIGSLRAECSGVLFCVDISPAVIEEARQKECSLIVSHHPVLFKGIKRISGNTPVEQSIALAIKYNICIYSCHTAIDSAPCGVSHRMAQMLGATPKQVLSPLKDRNFKVTAIVDAKEFDTAVTAISELSKEHSSITVSDIATYNSETDSQDPFGATTMHYDDLKQINAIVPKTHAPRLQDNLFQAIGHSLKSITVEEIDDLDNNIGLGSFAIFDEGIGSRALVELVKKTFNTPTARCTKLPDDEVTIRRIAMCGGSGGEFIPTALRMGAQAYISSDIKYHDFVDYRNDILLIDIGHFESEECTKQIFYDVVKEKFPNFACYKSQIEENPIKYI